MNCSIVYFGLQRCFQPWRRVIFMHSVRFIPLYSRFFIVPHGVVIFVFSWMGQCSLLLFEQRSESDEQAEAPVLVGRKFKYFLRHTSCRPSEPINLPDHGHGDSEKELMTTISGIDRAVAKYKIKCSKMIKRFDQRVPQNRECRPCSRPQHHQIRHHPGWNLHRPKALSQVRFEQNFQLWKNLCVCCPSVVCRWMGTSREISARQH